MAKIIEFYIPQSFGKISAWFPPVELGEVPNLHEIAGEMAVVADNANGLIAQVRGEVEGISEDARGLLTKLTMTVNPNQQMFRFALDNVNEMLETELPKIDRLIDQLNALSQHADDIIQNVN